jgi:hypothetical protein
MEQSSPLGAMFRHKLLHRSAGALVSKENQIRPRLVKSVVTAHASGTLPSSSAAIPMVADAIAVYVLGVNHIQA